MQSCIFNCLLGLQRCLFCSHVQSEETAILPMDGDVGTDELQSRVSELEDNVKDLNQKVDNLSMDNMALTTKLEVIREVERQQQEEIASLKERLVQAQVNMHFWSMQCLDLS